MRELSSLGHRIAIIGPSSSGKSTLCEKLGAKINAPIIHLDQLAHVSGTSWQRRPNEELVAEHDKIIELETWVMDGNYSVCMPKRLQRATMVIWLDPPLLGTIWRYVLRCVKEKGKRVGALEGATGEFKWALIRYTLCNYPKNRLKYQAYLAEIKTPFVKINSMSELNQYYAHWGLKR